MSQTVVPPAPAGDAAPATGPAGSPGPDGPGPGSSSGRVQAVSAAIRHYLDHTPGQLRAWSAVTVLAAVVLAFGGGAAMRERSAALDEAQRSAEHLVLVQRVQTTLVQADADATNSFLAFGLELRSQRLDYLDRIAAASRDLTAAASNGTETETELGSANAALTRYTGYVASARANNLQGFPVGASYLQEASDLLRTDVLPRLEAQATADSEAIESAYSRAGRAWLWLALVALLGLGVLVWAQVYLARRSRRILNLPLAAGTSGLLVAVLVAVAAMAVSQSQANDVRSGDLAEARALSDSRVAAFSAKANESLGLIARGSGGTEESKNDWQTAYERAVSSLGTLNGEARTALEAYAAEHQEIRALDDDGNWQDARTRAISNGNTSANAHFDEYADRTEASLKDRATAADTGLGDAKGPLFPVGLLVVLVGLLAAIGAWRGISQRLDEYR